jgi:hypothetical protein
MNEGRTPAIIVDIDGTVALNTGHRSPYDYSKVGNDVPNQPVLHAVAALHFTYQYDILYVSGREDSSREDTLAWLDSYAPDGKLFMRKAGDYRSDQIVKREIYEQEIEESYKIMAVFDDRDKVVRMWRDLGLTCFQVADGDF